LVENGTVVVEKESKCGNATDRFTVRKLSKFQLRLHNVLGVNANIPKQFHDDENGVNSDDVLKSGNIQCRKMDSYFTSISII
jgi:hypothetical protein